MQRLTGLLFALVGLLAAGCENDPTHFEMVFDPCAPLVLEPDDRMSGDQLASVELAIDMWNQVAEVGLSLEPIQGARTMPILLTGTEVYYGRFDDQAGAIWVADKLTDQRVRAVVLAHELGHAFSLYHIDPSERVSVMNEGNRHVAPDSGDREALARVWGDCVVSRPAD
jgi:hypothetical protein